MAAFIVPYRSVTTSTSLSFTGPRCQAVWETFLMPDSLLWIGARSCAYRYLPVWDMLGNNALAVSRPIPGPFQGTGLEICNH